MTEVFPIQDSSHGCRGLFRSAPQPPAHCVPGRRVLAIARLLPMVGRSTPRCSAMGRGYRPSTHRPSLSLRPVAARSGGCELLFPLTISITCDGSGTSIAMFGASRDAFISVTPFVCLIASPSIVPASSDASPLNSTNTHKAGWQSSSSTIWMAKSTRQSRSTFKEYGLRTTNSSSRPTPKTKVSLNPCWLLASWKTRTDASNLDLRDRSRSVAWSSGESNAMNGSRAVAPEDGPADSLVFASGSSPPFSRTLPQ